MRTTRRAVRAGALAIALAVTVALPPGSTSASPPDHTDRQKASFIYRLAQFVSWPPASMPAEPAPMRFCILARPSFANTLREVVDRRTVHARPLDVVHVDSTDELGVCHLLFVGASQMERFDEVATDLSERPVLTVGELPGFVSRGGMVNLIERNRKLRFEVDREAIEASGLRPASQLLRLASEAPASDREGR